MMIDGGPAPAWSNSGKTAADFLRWKMFVDQSWKNEFDFRKAPFRLDAVVCTHPDYDHFGGLMQRAQGIRLDLSGRGADHLNGRAESRGSGDHTCSIS
jgi:glyoxylase-like metal-dependent hydrolase (beta-lactamase superfamily II)